MYINALVKGLFFTFFVLLLVCVGLLISGKKVLVQEHLVKPGGSFMVIGHGDLGKSKDASLVCKYFTGRSFKIRVYWYSTNNLFGKEECPFLIAEDD